MFKIFVKILITLTIALVILSCASTPVVGSDESIVVIDGTRGGSWEIDPKISILLNGEEIASGRGRFQFVIPNGEYTIQARRTLYVTDILKFTTNNEKITFKVRKQILPILGFTTNYSILESKKTKL